VHAIGPLTAEFAALLQHPMTEVPGLARFGAEGGDWGAFITGRLGYTYAQNLIGVHLNPGVLS
jgi:hypothetical protein